MSVTGDIATAGAAAAGAPVVDKLDKLHEEAIQKYKELVALLAAYPACLDRASTADDKTYMEGRLTELITTMLAENAAQDESTQTVGKTVTDALKWPKARASYFPE